MNVWSERWCFGALVRFLELVGGLVDMDVRAGIGTDYDDGVDAVLAIEQIA